MGNDESEGIGMEYSEIYVKQSTLDNIVRGLTKNPRVKTLHKIALAFNMTLAKFLDFDELNNNSFDDDSDDE